MNVVFSTGLIVLLNSFILDHVVLFFQIFEVN